MKKSTYVFLFATIMSISSMLFAGEPKSLVKQATVDLFEDNVVDAIDVGINDGTGLWYGGYNSAAYEFDFGYGTYLGPIWFSICDTGNFKSDRNHKMEKKTDVVAVDTVDIDYTDTEDIETKNSTNNVKNKLYAAFAINKVGAQLFWVTDNKGSANDEKTDVKITNQDVIESKDITTTKNINNTNSIGAFLNGIKTPELGGINFYAQLDEVGVTIDKDDETKNTTIDCKQNGEGGQTDVMTTDWVYNKDTYTPFVKFTLGLSFPSFGNSTTKFTLSDRFNYNIDSKKQTVTYTDKNDEVYTTTDTEYKITYDYGKNNTFTNVATPKFTNSYDVGDALKVKTFISAPITISNTKSGNFIVTETQKTTTTDKLTGLSKVTESEETHVNAGWDSSNNTLGNSSIKQDVTKFTTEINPQAGIGIVYAVKPGKFDLNLGAKWYAGTFTWTKENKRNPKIVTHKKTTATDEYGNSTVTTDEKTIWSADTQWNDANDSSEESSFNYSATAPSNDVLYVGSTLYFNEKVKMDMLYSTGFKTFSLFGTSDGLLTSSLAIDFTIKF